MLTVFFVSYYYLAWFDLRDQHALESVISVIRTCHPMAAESSDLNAPAMTYNPKELYSKQASAPKTAITSPQSPNTTIAYLISVTSCPDIADLETVGLRKRDTRQTFLDSAAVLKHSIHLNSRRNPTSGSVYDYAIYAFVHPEAIACQPALEYLGYTVLIRDTPIKGDEIQNDLYRKILFDPSLGCCGEKELLKLYSYTMHEYAAVLHLDLDMIILKPLDPLFDVMLMNDDTHVKEIPHAMRPHDRIRTQRVNAMFTRDYPMGGVGNPPNSIGMQGGFLLVRPNQTAFDELVAIVRRGNFGPPPVGWHDGNTMFPDFYGAPQIQGLIGFYYGHYHPDQMVELDRCRHNNMVDKPRDKQGICRAPVEDDCPDCRVMNVTDLYSAHFTFCLKPVRICLLQRNVIIVKPPVPLPLTLFILFHCAYVQCSD